MELLSAVASIIIIDIVLSGDNAVVIGMAAHRLPDKQRKLAILLGGIGAVMLRVFITSIATITMQIPVIKLLGGLALVWIAFSLLKQEEEAHEHTKVADGLRAAVQTILLADFVMSLDNSIAVAGVAHGNIPLLIFGLVLSMPIVMLTGSIIASLINRLWWLAYVGSAVIAWTGAEMVLEDQVVHNALAASLGLIELIIPAVAVVVTVAFSHWFHRHATRASASQPTIAPAFPDGSSDTPSTT